MRLSPHLRNTRSTSRRRFFEAIGTITACCTCWNCCAVSDSGGAAASATGDEQRVSAVRVQCSSSGSPERRRICFSARALCRLAFCFCCRGGVLSTALWRPLAPAPASSSSGHWTDFGVGVGVPSIFPVPFAARKECERRRSDWSERRAVLLMRSRALLSPVDLFVDDPSAAAESPACIGP